MPNNYLTIKETDVFKAAAVLDYLDKLAKQGFDSFDEVELREVVEHNLLDELNKIDVENALNPTKPIGALCILYNRQLGNLEIAELDEEHESKIEKESVILDQLFQLIVKCASC